MPPQALISTYFISSLFSWLSVSRSAPYPVFSGIGGTLGVSRVRAVPAMVFAHMGARVPPSFQARRICVCLIQVTTPRVREWHRPLPPVVRASIHAMVPLVQRGHGCQPLRGQARVAAVRIVVPSLLRKGAPPVPLRLPIRVPCLIVLPALAHAGAPSSHLGQCQTRKTCLTRPFVIHPSVVVSSSACNEVSTVACHVVPHGALRRRISVRLARIPERTPRTPALRAPSLPPRATQTPTGYQAAASGSLKRPSPVPLLRPRPSALSPRVQSQVFQGKQQPCGTTARRYARRSTRTRASAGLRGHEAGLRVLRRAACKTDSPPSPRGGRSGTSAQRSRAARRSSRRAPCSRCSRSARRLRLRCRTPPLLPPADVRARSPGSGSPSLDRWPAQPDRRRFVATRARVVLRWARATARRRCGTRRGRRRLRVWRISSRAATARAIWRLRLRHCPVVRMRLVLMPCSRHRRLWLRRKKRRTLPWLRGLSNA